MRLWRVIGAQLHGVSLVPLTLSYQPTADPVAIGLHIATCNGPADWYVSRDVFRDGLCPDRVPVYAYEAAARVHLSTLPCIGYSLLTLRSAAGARWPLTVPCAGLGAFLALTYQACPPEQEAQVVADQLSAQIGLFITTRGGRGTDG